MFRLISNKTREEKALGQGAQRILKLSHVVDIYDNI